MMSTPTTTEALTNKIRVLEGKIERAAAQRDAALRDIARLAIEDAKINGELRRRDEAQARVDALTRERQRLEDEELPAALARDGEARRAKLHSAARDAHARHARLAADFDAALAKANAALADLMENDPAYGRAMREAGLRAWRVDWPRRLSQAMWAATARGGAGRVWSAWSGRSGSVEVLRPVLAMALGLNKRWGPQTLAEQLAALAPRGTPDKAPAPREADADPLDFDPSEAPERAGQ